MRLPRRVGATRGRCQEEEVLQREKEARKHEADILRRKEEANLAAEQAWLDLERARLEREKREKEAKEKDEVA